MSYCAYCFTTVGGQKHLTARRTVCDDCLDQLFRDRFGSSSYEDDEEDDQDAGMMLFCFIVTFVLVMVAILAVG